MTQGGFTSAMYRPRGWEALKNDLKTRQEIDAAVRKVWNAEEEGED